jgi:hypothetical protein
MQVVAGVELTRQQIQWVGQVVLVVAELALVQMLLDRRELLTLVAVVALAEEIHLPPQLEVVD